MGKNGNGRKILEISIRAHEIDHFGDKVYDDLNVLVFGSRIWVSGLVLYVPSTQEIP